MENNQVFQERYKRLIFVAVSNRTRFFTSPYSPSNLYSFLDGSVCSQVESAFRPGWNEGEKCLFLARPQFLSHYVLHLKVHSQLAKWKTFSIFSDCFVVADNFWLFGTKPVHIKHGVLTVLICTRRRMEKRFTEMEFLEFSVTISISIQCVIYLVKMGKMFFILIHMKQLTPG